MDQNQSQNRNITTEQETLFDREVASKGADAQSTDRRRHGVCFAGDEVKFIDAWRAQMDPGASFADAARDILVFAQGAIRAQKVGEALGFAPDTASINSAAALSAKLSAPAKAATPKPKPEAPKVDVAALVAARAAAAGPFIATIPELKVQIPALANVGAPTINHTLHLMAERGGDTIVQLLGKRNPGGDTQGSYAAWAFMRAQSTRAKTG